MQTVFTICSNNYLAQAKALGDSLLRHNPDYHFIIGLVDEFSPLIDYTFFAPYEIIPIVQIEIEGFDDMFNIYNITELNTAVKPYIFNFLFARDANTDTIIYLDPDILIYNKLADIEQQLLDSNIVLTPHIFTPIYDNYELGEPDLLNAGLYNLGFIAVKKSDESLKFLNWWMIKLKTQCFIAFEKGLFVDQLWINFAPLYFKKVSILTHLGHNVAYWNLHERRIVKNNGKYLVNNDYPLVFYHFSGYLFTKTESISKYQNRFTFSDREDIKPLFEEYTSTVLNNKHSQFSSIECLYVRIKNEREEEEHLRRKQLRTFQVRAKEFVKRKMVSLKSKLSNSKAAICMY